MYLIQGVFFQKPPDTKEDEFVGWDDIFCYHGFVRYNEEANDYVGEMEDIIGKSRVLAFDISPNELKFAKRYLDRDSFIYYSFSKKENWWEGHYVGDSCIGESKCVITKVSVDFFLSSKTTHKKTKKTTPMPKRSPK